MSSLGRLTASICLVATLLIPAHSAEASPAKIKFRIDNEKFVAAYQRYIDIESRDPLARDFEYAWNANLSAAAPNTPAEPVMRNRKGNETRISFEYAAPDTRQRLYVRAKYEDGSVGPWSSSIVKTPKTPLIIALGDSVTSGHHRLSFTTGVDCNDSSYGYPAYIYDELLADAPSSQWRPRYENLARSGYGTGQVISGGRDACGNTFYTDSPLDEAINLIRARSKGAGSWVRVYLTMGINDTNWTDVVIPSIIKSYNDSYSEEACAADLRKWNFSAVNPGFKARASFILEQLTEAGASVPIVWLGYYNFAGTGFDASESVPVGIPATCEAPMDRQLQRLTDSQEEIIDYAAQRTGQSALWHDTDSVMHGRSDFIQPLLDAALLDQGFPHPNQYGAMAIASSAPKF